MIVANTPPITFITSPYFNTSQRLVKDSFLNLFHKYTALLEGYRSNYSALQLKKIFIDKSPKFLAKVFSKIDLMQRTIEEIIEDRRLEVLTSATEIADKICNLNLSEEDFEDRMYRLTIPTEEMDYHYRGITQVGL